MKKLVVCFLVFASLIAANAKAQDRFIKYDFMKVLPGQDFVKLETAWANYHRELVDAGFIQMHRVWKALPGQDVDYDYMTSTVYNSYKDAVGLGKNPVTADMIKAKYPEAYEIAQTSSKVRTMVRSYIQKVDFGIWDSTFTVTPKQSIMKIEYVKSKNSQYKAAEIAFSSKFHQFRIDNKLLKTFIISSLMGAATDSYHSHFISSGFTDIDQAIAPLDSKKLNFTPAELKKIDELIAMRDIKKVVLFVNVINTQK